MNFSNPKRIFGQILRYQALKEAIYLKTSGCIVSNLLRIMLYWVCKSRFCVFMIVKFCSSLLNIVASKRPTISSGKQLANDSVVDVLSNNSVKNSFSATTSLFAKVCNRIIKVEIESVIKINSNLYLQLQKFFTFIFI